jgi:hypothetical protein
MDSRALGPGSGILAFGNIRLSDLWSSLCPLLAGSSGHLAGTLSLPTFGWNKSESVGSRQVDHEDPQAIKAWPGGEKTRRKSNMAVSHRPLSPAVNPQIKEIWQAKPGG